MNPNKDVLAKRPDGTQVVVPGHLVGTHAWRIQRLSVIKEPDPVKLAPMPVITSEPDNIQAPVAEVQPKRGPGRPPKTQA